MLLLIFINEADYLQTKMLRWLERKGRLLSVGVKHAHIVLHMKNTDKGRRPGTVLCR